ncbi:7-alpha-hydroxycholest-4-en-3-one 12-alpha-hydroxylase [Tolypocladium ophioglossoides CBS 100239]|uniref:7-alpha-hydroxycholest-4-en-3-one 12-alpha-hydroxylase n=1 Tax=Tolypocladium ophioglossoides (strain CBS 100239) TaxID=1163406 RepID=A0A0L0N3C7_TOLOC|nr:7-alpha-hydroxycholest-4-en-3-one 12-alpha-hydroxylase [Tolypocladium ophioglossoides CBS 100239]
MSPSVNSTPDSEAIRSDDPSTLVHTVYGSAGILDVSSSRLLAVVFSLSLLVLWRLWRFTVLPMLYPDQPKEFPHWIPGHGRAFFRDSNGLLARARKHFGNSKEPFALTAFGMTFYVVTQVKQSVQAYRNSETLSFEDFVQGLMRTNGNSEEVIKAVYTALPTDKAGCPNPRGESLGVLAQRMHAHQLHPGDNLVLLQKEVQRWLDCHVNLGDIRASPSATSPNFKSVEVPLYRWCSEYFIQLGQDVYFGETLAEIDPTLPSTFLVFDELIWKMLYQYPDVLSSDMIKPRSRVIASLNRYFQVPQSQRTGGSAWLINAMENEMRALGVDGEDLAVVVFHLYLAINTNTRKTAFWVLAHLLHDLDLMAAYCRETAPAFRGADLVDPFMIQDAAACPQVDAVWHETLRMSGWAASVRLITQDTLIGNKRMCKGNRVMVPHRLLHFDKGIFGEATHQFRTDRWLNNKDLSRSPSFRPFGAGKTMCSGRFLARFSVTTFVATLLRRFHVELVGQPAFPRADEGRPVLGTMSIREGDDFKVRLTPKAELI